MSGQRLFAWVAAAATICVVGACAADSSKAAADTTKTRRVAQSSEGEIALPHEPYSAGAVASTGRISGTVSTAEALALDSAVHECVGSGDTSPRDTTDNGDAIIWLSGITQGKPPTSEKRTEMQSVNCDLEPRVQSVVAGTTINLVNDDRALHRLIFTKLGTDDTITVMPFTNEGEIVPSDKLGKTSGIIEIRCKQHSWTHGYLAVFDNPYFAVVDRSGRFSIDSVPPGHYTLNSWVPGWKSPHTQAVDVTAGGTVKLDLQ